MARGIDLLRTRSQLPPREYWLFNKGDINSVPLDNLGLVDAVAAAEFLKSIIDPSYRFRLWKDRHHKACEEADYSEEFEKEFREMPINIVRLPRDAHELWHLVYEKPPKPDRELMETMVSSFQSTTGMFEDAREVIRLQRHEQRLVNGTFRARQGEFRSIASRQRGIDFHKRRFEERLAVYESLPPECVLEQISTSATLPTIAKRLGASAIIKSPMMNFSPALEVA